MKWRGLDVRITPTVPDLGLPIYLQNHRLTIDGELRRRSGMAKSSASVQAGPVLGLGATNNSVGPFTMFSVGSTLTGDSSSGLAQWNDPRLLAPTVTARRSVLGTDVTYTWTITRGSIYPRSFMLYSSPNGAAGPIICHGEIPLPVGSTSVTSTTTFNIADDPSERFFAAQEKLGDLLGPMSVWGDGLAGFTWNARGIVGQWGSIAFSTDGTYGAVINYGGQMYTTDDRGLTWTARDSARDWAATCISADGSKMAAAVFNGRIYTSSDYGVTWTPHDSARQWNGIAMSDDGTKLVASANGDNLYTSTDSGATWVPRDSVRGWAAVATSANGTKLVAADQGGFLYTSTDSGVTWGPVASAQMWAAGVLASSSDGSRLLAGVQGGTLYTSFDSGATWVARESARQWGGCSVSDDGLRAIAVVGSGSGSIYLSFDGGVTWAAQTDPGVKDWRGAGCAGDGMLVAASNRGGYIWIGG